ncbi:Uncharacterized protein MLTONO_3136 [Mesorhizobium loti]|nr:Uncharacterized protein MLTONO_3136 [Mesorhizobium loti]
MVLGCETIQDEGAHRGQRLLVKTRKLRQQQASAGERVFRNCLELSDVGDKRADPNGHRRKSGPDYADSQKASTTHDDL